MYHNFNPFNKSFFGVKEEDLKKLNEVSEGWYIEYKGEKPEASKIAKSIASFANYKGGIYFIGIEADEINFPKEFIGVKHSPDVIVTAVEGNLQPVPFFQTYTIPLNNGKHILMTIIPEGIDPPYIHSNGKIYIRHGSTSNPIDEIRNRYEFDKLYSKSQENQNKVEEFRKLNYGVFENLIPYLAVFINPYPFNNFEIANLFDPEKIQSIMNHFSGEYSIEETLLNNDISYAMPTDTLSINGEIIVDRATSSYNSIIMESFVQNDCDTHTLELDVNGNIKMLTQLDYGLSEEEFGTIEKRIPKPYLISDLSRIKFIRGITLYAKIAGLLSKYTNYLKNNVSSEDIEIKFQLFNCKRCCLYFSKSDSYLDHITKFDLPLCKKDNQYFPNRPLKLKINNYDEFPITETNKIFGEISKALGILPGMALKYIMDELHYSKPD